LFLVVAGKQDLLTCEKVGSESLSRDTSMGYVLLDN
jgi:hypothetical protein